MKRLMAAVVAVSILGAAPVEAKPKKRMKCSERANHPVRPVCPRQSFGSLDTTSHPF